MRVLSGRSYKIVTGGTPLDESTSAIARLYGQSDQRVFEVPCPSCGAFHEIAWESIEWPAGRAPEGRLALPVVRGAGRGTAQGADGQNWPLAHFAAYHHFTMTALRPTQLNSYPTAAHQGLEASVSNTRLIVLP
jgi:hypothetical protein